MGSGSPVGPAKKSAAAASRLGGISLVHSSLLSVVLNEQPNSVQPGPFIVTGPDGETVDETEDE
jgi:hypothetical protein